jgi:hypothetical protein
LQVHRWPINQLRFNTFPILFLDLLGFIIIVFVIVIVVITSVLWATTALAVPSVVRDPTLCGEHMLELMLRLKMRVIVGVFLHWLRRLLLLG